MKKVQKVKAEGDLKFHIILSFIIWQSFFYLILDMILDIGIFMMLLGELSWNLTPKIIIVHALWILIDCLILLVSYFFNHRNTTFQIGFKSTRRYVLIWFYIITLALNWDFIYDSFKLHAVITVLSVIVHMIVVYFVNRFLFKHLIER